MPLGLSCGRGGEFSLYRIEFCIGIRVKVEIVRVCDPNSI